MCTKDLLQTIWDRCFFCYQEELEGATIRLADGRTWQITYNGKVDGLGLKCLTPKQHAAYKRRQHRENQRWFKQVRQNMQNKKLC